MYTDLKGKCPMYVRSAIPDSCVDKCRSDENCYGSTRCCDTKCGRDCILPQLPHKCTSSRSDTFLCYTFSTHRLVCLNNSDHVHTLITCVACVDEA